jgi:hypothetical protein
MAVSGHTLPVAPFADHHRTTVSGCTSTKPVRQFGQMWIKAIQNSRSRT